MSILEKTQCIPSEITFLPFLCETKQRNGNSIESHSIQEVYSTYQNMLKSVGIMLDQANTLQQIKNYRRKLTASHIYLL